MLKFNKLEVLALCALLKPTDKILLVGDEGIYLMSFGEPRIAMPEDGPRTQVFAKGCNPDIDKNWFDVKGKLFGYDDEHHELGTAADFTKFATLADSNVVIQMTKSNISVGYDHD